MPWSRRSAFATSRRSWSSSTPGSTCPTIGEIGYDLAFGGGFYAYVEVAEVGLTCTPADASRLIETGQAIKTGGQ